MARCATCNSTVLIGGVRDGELRFCNQRCHQRGALLALSQQLPEPQVRHAVAEVHQGSCPVCNGPGPVDVSTAHKIWSVILMTSWRSDPSVCCRSCGRKRQTWALLLSLVAGWWGIPWGFIMTPVQIGRNVVGLFRSHDPYQPSPELERIVRLMLAAELADRQGSEGAATGS